MARLSSSPFGMAGQRLRSLAAAALVVGAAGAFFPGGHAAHAATGVPSVNTCVAGSFPVDPVNSITGGTTVLTPFDTGASIHFTIDGNLITVTGNGTSHPAYTQTSYSPVTGACNQTYANADEAQAGGSLNAMGGSCTFVSADFTVFSDSSSRLIVALSCKGGQFDLMINSPGAGALRLDGTSATPELGSGELLATGLVPALGIFLYRRRRQRRAGK